MLIRPLQVRTTPLAALGCVALVVLASPALAQNQPSFVGVGDLSGGGVDSTALGVSDDGLTVVGGSESASGTEAYRWTESGGMVGLGSLGGGNFFSIAAGVSDGGVVVGTTTTGAESSRGFRWTPPSGPMTVLNNFSCGFGCLAPDVATAHAISGDGQVVVGAGADGPFLGDPYVEAARWTGGGTGISALGHLSGGGDASDSFAVSNTGGVIVGQSDSSSGNQGFVWNGSLNALAAINAGNPQTTAMAISSDGSVVAGAANSAPSGTAVVEAAIWTGASWGTVTSLGSIPGASVAGSRALGITGDGSIVVGTGNDASANDVAFIWDASGGMRELKQELEDDYGLDLTGWTLTQATAISDINVAGEVTIVGSGENPSGDSEGWVAVLSATACNDGIDNDFDGDVDYPADPECTKKGDRSEEADCDDGIDNDGDGQIDNGADPECTSLDDVTEEADCDDGIDNDGDALADYPADLGCRDAAMLIENPACNDGVDNDSDTYIDFPFDPGCLADDDFSEGFDCNDGVDNDGDGQTDYPADPQCEKVNDPSEDFACMDRVDNDKDFRVDYPEAYPACESATDDNEAAQCGDSLDNDSDGDTDFAADSDCLSVEHLSESPGGVQAGDLLVVDRRAGRLFAIDPATGNQVVLSEGAELSSPQGVAVRSEGQIVVADLNGLVEVDAQTGAQRVFSDPIFAFESMQLVFDDDGDPVVLERFEIAERQWVYGGIGSGSTLLAVPTPETPFPNLLAFAGDTLAREAGGDYLTTGIGAFGDGIHRIDENTFAVTSVTPGFSSDKWMDLALEASGQIIAVGDKFGVGEAVYRVDPVTGSETAIATAGFTDLTAVAVDPGGDLYVADAGTCTESGCTGAKIVRLNASTGAVISTWSGGAIESEMDLAIVTALPACNDGVDNDADLLADYPADPGCTAPGDTFEEAQCADGVDNDGDGDTDEPADLGCGDTEETSREDPYTQCNDGIDNDADGLVDWDGAGFASEDPNCFSNPRSKRERPPSKGCGLGGEAALALAALAAARIRGRRRANRPVG